MLKYIFDTKTENNIKNETSLASIQTMFLIQKALLIDLNIHFGL